MRRAASKTTTWQNNYLFDLVLFSLRLALVDEGFMQVEWIIWSGKRCTDAVLNSLIRIEWIFWVSNDCLPVCKLVYILKVALVRIKYFAGIQILSLTFQNCKQRMYPFLSHSCLHEVWEGYTLCLQKLPGFRIAYLSLLTPFHYVQLLHLWFALRDLGHDVLLLG